MTDLQKDAVTYLYEIGWNPEDIAEQLYLDETEVIELCSELLEDMENK